MDIACVVVFGVLCIPPEYRDVTKLGGLYSEVDEQGNPRVISEAAIEQLGLRIDVIETDFIVYSPTSVLASVCEDSGCLYYRKYCDSGLRECTYLVGVKWPRGNDARQKLFLNKFVIAYYSDEALQLAEERISIAVGGETGGAQFPMSQLAVLSATPEVIMCPYQRGRQPTIMQGC